MSYSDNIKTAKFLITRLERLSVDSYWAHRASGIRGALLRFIEENTDLDMENTNHSSENLILESLIKTGYFLLEKAASDIPE